MSAPVVLLDLFCGSGGAARGYQAAGFEVVGVDNLARRLRHYPGESFCGDWRDGLAWALGRYDVRAVHASSPCQAYSVTRHTHNNEHPELVEPVREALEATGLPWVMENVPGAPLRDPLTLCGTMFDLRAADVDGSPLFLRRHRLFESNVALMAPGQPCRCSDFKRRGIKCAGVYGGYTPSKAVGAALLGLPGSLPQDALAQSIPPAYAEHVGRYLLDHIEREAAA